MRIATLEMLHNLAKERNEITDYAKDVFYDMFNDEDFSIRKNAVLYCLEMNDDGINQIHFSRLQLILGDQSHEIRNLAYKLVGSLQYTSSQQLIKIISILTSNGERWDSDLDGIYGCLMLVPKKNMVHFEAVMKVLLKLSPPYIPPTVHMNEISSKCTMVFVFNGLKFSPDLAKYLPIKVLDSQAYLYSLLHPYIPKV